MKRLTFLSVVVILVLWIGRSAMAEPAWGGTCLSCHGVLQPNTLYVVGHDATADPDESATGAPDRGTLKVFQTFRGQIQTLQAQVVGLEAEDTYAVQLKRLRFPGVESNGQLSYSADCDWPEWGETAAYYSEPVVSYRWGTGPIEFAFDLGIQGDADRDYYDLVFAVAGKLNTGGGLFYGEEHFYLQVSLPGDVDDDGDVDLTDFARFRICLGEPGVTSPPPGCNAADFARSDLDIDADADLHDFAVFQESFGG